MLKFFQLFSIFFLYFPAIFGDFNEHFANFVEDNYGKTFLNALQRTELGEIGSFGGKDSANEKIERDPIIFVHGVSDIAGGKMLGIATKFKKMGYQNGELYATTYADGSRNNILSWAQYGMKCEHVKQIRTLILAVRYYTNRDVDIIAYSLGVPIARKAVLGGICVDTKEDLGSPLTAYIDTFVGVAGPNHGISVQIAGISFPGCVIGAIPILPICSRVIGLYSGLCPTESEFLTDINKEEHYEGKYVFSIYSKTDNWIGYDVCGEVTAKIPGEDNYQRFTRYNHDEILEKTTSLQFEMIEYHRVQDKSEFDKILNARRIIEKKKREQKFFIRRANIHRSKTTLDDKNDKKESRKEQASKSHKSNKRNVASFEEFDEKLNNGLNSSILNDSLKISVADKFSGMKFDEKSSDIKNKTEQHYEKHNYNQKWNRFSSTSVYNQKPSSIHPSWKTRIQNDIKTSTKQIVNEITTLATPIPSSKSSIIYQKTNRIEKSQTLKTSKKENDGYHTHVRILFDE